MSLFSGLYTGSSGLVTNQNSLNTTAHNLANIGTEGYTRQQVTQANRHYDTVGRAYISTQQVGSGVSYAEVRAVRDVFLDKRYRIENGRSQYYNTGYEVTTEIETLFGEMQGTEFQESLTELERAVQELQKNPSDATNQGLLVSKAYTFIERSQAVYTGLSEYQDNLDVQIKDMVEKINDYGKKIYELNDKIKKIEAGGIEHANDLRDARDKLLDELSGFARISYDENIHGVVTVQLEGVDFVSEDYVSEIALLSGKEYNKKYEQEIEDGSMPKMEESFHVPVWKQLDRTVISFTEEISSDLDTDIGALKALVHARGNTRGTYRDLYKGEDYVRDYLKDGYGGYLSSYKAADLALPVSQRKYHDASGDQIVSDDVIAEDIIKENESVVDEIITEKTPELNEKYDRLTARSTVVNIMAEFDNLIHGIVTGMNSILQGGKDASGSAVNLFKKITEPKDDAGNVKPMADGTDGWSTANIYVDPAVRRQPTLLANGFIMESDGMSVDQSRADRLADLFLDDNAGKLNPTTRGSLRFSEYYVALSSENAIRGEIYREVALNEKTAAEAIDAQRQQVVGVSDNEELTNMIRYQNAYNASSRYINTISAMLDNLFGMLR